MRLLVLGLQQPEPTYAGKKETKAQSELRKKVARCDKERQTLVLRNRRAKQKVCSYV